jgi:hypothetical protein
MWRVYHFYSRIFLFTPTFSGAPRRPKQGVGVSGIKQTAVIWLYGVS